MNEAENQTTTPPASTFGPPSSVRANAASLLVQILLIPVEYLGLIFGLYEKAWPLTICMVILIGLTAIWYGKRMAAALGTPAFSWIERWWGVLLFPLMIIIVKSLDYVDIDASPWFIVLPYFFITFWTKSIIAFPATVLCYGSCILAYWFYLRKGQNLSPMPKLVTAILLSLFMIYGGTFGYLQYQRYLFYRDVVPTYVGDHYGYEKSWLGYLKPYHPWNPQNVLAKLERSATFKLKGSSKIIWDGPAAFYPLSASFVQAIFPSGHQISEENSGLDFDFTNVALEHLRDKTADLVIIGQWPSQQTALAAKQDSSFTYTPIALDAFVFLVDQDFPVNNLTAQQVRDIYAGKITNWQEVGGPAKKIMAFQRPEDSDSQMAMHQFMGDIPLMPPPQEVYHSMKTGVHKEVAQFRSGVNALGYSFRYYASKMTGGSLKFLAIDGIAPTPENIANGHYPLIVQVMAVTRRNTKKEIKPLLNWILGPQGQELVAKTGYIPINLLPKKKSSKTLGKSK